MAASRLPLKYFNRQLYNKSYCEGRVGEGPRWVLKDVDCPPTSVLGDKDLPTCAGGAPPSKPNFEKDYGFIYPKF